MSQDLPMTAYALLGLLTFGDPEVTAYELKQRADSTLRFYWTSPAMSQVYSETQRLADLGLVTASGEGRATRYRIADAGRDALRSWIEETQVGFPVWKHPVALRLIIGHVSDPARLRSMLVDYLADLEETRRDLQEVRDRLVGADAVGEPLRYPSLVADWGLAHFDSERDITRDLLVRLDEETT
jgi:DNA-binding PadR family transcriptional regulator